MATVNPICGGAAALDYDNANNLKLYNKAVKGLEDAHNYDLSPGKLKAFLDQIRNRSRQYGWANVLHVPTIVVASAVSVNRNILDAYGTATLAECTANATVCRKLPLLKQERMVL
jgi:Mlc titration factor MtfA (ptsG expression regulator)